VDEHRPTPEAMLERADVEAESELRGKLKIFFGMAPGVGKTYSLLQSAEVQKRVGMDVVLGWVETHGRRETEELTHGFERLPPRTADYRGLKLLEFDIDGALRRRRLDPLDELAHTNAAGSRHVRRWPRTSRSCSRPASTCTRRSTCSHVEPERRGGLDHRCGRAETVPDAPVDRAYEIELIDPDAGRAPAAPEGGQGLRAGRAERALEKLPRRATRRRCASSRRGARPSASTRRASSGAASRAWPSPLSTRERVLVAVGRR
jgi:two-component system sensor histidine kinase KdpD